MTKSPRLAILEGLFVTFLWSSSYVLVKIGLIDITPFFFATVRYIVAFSILFLLNAYREGWKLKLDRHLLIYYVAAGLTGFTLAQGLQFVGLSLLPAVSVTFLLSFTPLFVIFIETIFLKTKISKMQIFGILLTLVGAYVYFPIQFSSNETMGIIIVLLSGLAWATYMVLTRAFRQKNEVSSVSFTTLTMGIGCLGLMILTLVFEGFQPIEFGNWLIIFWLSLVNTAFAFILWNHVLKILKAYELSILQNTMLLQIAFLAFVFLGEEITTRMIFGMALVLIGVTIVQLKHLK